MRKRKGAMYKFTDFKKCVTLSPTIMEVENDPNFIQTNLGDAGIFHFHEGKGELLAAFRWQLLYLRVLPQLFWNIARHYCGPVAAWISKEVASFRRRRREL